MLRPAFRAQFSAEMTSECVQTIYLQPDLSRLRPTYSSLNQVKKKNAL